MTSPAVAMLLAVIVVAGWWPAPSSAPRGRVMRPRRRLDVSALGRLVRPRLPAHRFTELVSDRLVGGGVVVMVVLLVVLPPAALMVPFVVLGWAMRQVRRRRARHEQAFLRTLPEAIDLLSLAVGSGLTARLALDAVVPWLPSPFVAPVEDVQRRTSAGEALVDALERNRSLVPVPGRPLFAALLAAERDGAPLLPALERASTEARRQRRVAAESRARTIPVTMLLPLVTCVLPAFALLTVVPLLLGGVAELELPG